MMPPTFLCGKCGAECAVEPDEGPAVCPQCCEDHDYVSDSGEHYCQHCGDQPPDDWYYCDDDVGFGIGPIGPAPDELRGIPASAMNGNAMERHKDPAAWDRWVAFSDSWGHP